MLKCDEVDVNATVYSRTTAARTPLSGASEPHIIKMLLDAKADVNPKDCETVLRGACAALRVDAVQMLLEAKAGVNWQPEDGQSATSYAVYRSTHGERTVNDQLDIINLLCDAGAKPWDVFGSKNDLSQGFSCNNREDARAFAFLLSRRPELLEARDSAGRTPLLAMAGNYSSKKGIIEVLVDAGADVLAADDENQTVLLHAFDKSFVSRDTYTENMRVYLQFLLEAGADPVQGSDRDGNTLLMRVITSSTISSPWARETDRIGWDSPKDHICSLFLADILDAVASRGAGASKGVDDDEAGAEQVKKRQRI
jgi:ankyrin repeat protein